MSTSTKANLEFNSLIDLINSMAPIGPSFKEIMDLWGLRSRGAVHYRLQSMKALGLIDWLPNRARSIHIRRARFFMVVKPTENYDAYLVEMKL